MKDVMQLTRQELEDELKEKFIGRTWESYGGLKYPIFRYIQERFEKDYPEIARQLTYKDAQHSQVEFQIRLGKSYFIWITCKRKMVKRGNGSTSWVYRTSSEYALADIEISEFDRGQETLQDVVSSAVASTKQQNEAELQRKIRGIEIMKDVMTKYGLDVYGARDLCAFIDRNFYSLSDYAKGAKPMPTLG